MLSSHRGRRNPENFGCAGSGDELTLWWLCQWLIASNVAVAAQATHLFRGEAFTADCFASLATENAGDDTGRVIDIEAPERFDGVFVGVDARRIEPRTVRYWAVCALHFSSQKVAGRHQLPMRPKEGRPAGPFASLRRWLDTGAFQHARYFPHATEYLRLASAH